MLRRPARRQRKEPAGLGGAPSQILPEPLAETAEAAEQAAGALPLGDVDIGLVATARGMAEQARAGREGRPRGRLGEPLEPDRLAQPDLLAEDVACKLAHAMELRG